MFIFLLLYAEIYINLLWANELNVPLVLVHYDGRRFDVAFRLYDKALGECQAVQYSTPELENERYIVRVNLIQI